MTGHVIVAGQAYSNSWVEDGKAVRLVLCPLCNDEGRQRDDEGEATDYCDCYAGEALRERDDWRARWRAGW